MKRRRYAWPVLCLLLSVIPLTGRAACTITVTSVAFGVYDVFAVADKLSTGTVDIRCTPKTTFTVTLSKGSGATFAARNMTSGANLLPYNLYKDASRVTIWGDGTAGTGTNGANDNRATYTIYGRIPARQNAAVGSYSDTIIASVIF
jgi:spore coat protein U-like protein